MPANQSTIIAAFLERKASRYSRVNLTSQGNKLLSYGWYELAVWHDSLEHGSTILFRGGKLCSSSTLTQLHLAAGMARDAGIAIEYIPTPNYRAAEIDPANVLRWEMRSERIPVPCNERDSTDC